VASILYTPFQIKRVSPALRARREISFPLGAHSFRIFEDEIFFCYDDSFCFLRKGEKQSRRKVYLPGIRAMSQAGVLAVYDGNLYFHQLRSLNKEKIASEGLPLADMLLFPSFADGYQRDGTIYALTKDGRVYMNILHGSPWSEVILDGEKHLGSLRGDNGILFFLEKSAYLISEKSYWQKIDDLSSDMLGSEKFFLLAGDPFFLQDNTLFDKRGEVYKEDIRDALAFDDLLLLHSLDGSLSLSRAGGRITSLTLEERAEGLALSGDQLLVVYGEEDDFLRGELYRIP
jgi:hypothetical protein